MTKNLLTHRCVMLFEILIGQKVSQFVSFNKDYRQLGSTTCTPHIRKQTKMEGAGLQRVAAANVSLIADLSVKSTLTV